MLREPDIDLSPTIGDEAKFTTCYMCACRCGIKVHIRDGKIRYIEGNRNHPVNKGVLCGKGSSGIMQHYSPARLRKPLKRVGERRPVRRDRMGGGAVDRGRLAQRDPARRPVETRLLYRAGPEPILDRLVGGAVRRPISPPMAVSARSTWRPPASIRSADRSGASAARLGTGEIFPSFRRRRGPRIPIRSRRG